MLCACLIALVGCTTQINRSDVEYPLTVELKRGASRMVNSDLTVRFVSVTSDSRCPTGVQCAWAGNAEVELELTGSATETVRLNTGAQFPRTELYQGYSITLLELKPYPTEGRRIDASSYVAVLSVDKEVSASD
ncbi:MAG: hypothetical protein D3924_08870 [Candidatus Electrothrix sp. AR4]|nr:hypothetical protein [Candidatus Electrothrix sp. AR4]